MALKTFMKIIASLLTLLMLVLAAAGLYWAAFLNINVINEPISFGLKIVVTGLSFLIPISFAALLSMFITGYFE